MTAAGICPFADWRPVMSFGYPRGRGGQNKPAIFVDHIAAGWKSTMDYPGWWDSVGASVTFAIGKDGSISQYVNILDAHWGNGISDRAVDMSNRRLAALVAEGTWSSVPGGGYALHQGGVNLFNSRSISIEHEGFPSDKWTGPMLQSDIRLKRWCITELARLGLPMVVDDDILVGHHQIVPSTRSRCPGPYWPRLTILQGISPLPEVEDMTRDETLALIREELGKRPRQQKHVLIRESGLADIYLVIGGMRVHLVDAETFESMGEIAGFSWRDVRDLLPGHPLLALPVLGEHRHSLAGLKTGPAA